MSANTETVNAFSDRPRTCVPADGRLADPADTRPTRDGGQVHGGPDHALQVRAILQVRAMEGRKSGVPPE